MRGPRKYSHIDRRQLLVLQGSCGYRLMEEPPQDEKILRILLYDYQVRGYPENKIMEEDFLFLPLLKSSDFFLNSCAYLQQEWNSRDGPVKNEIITSALCILLYIIIDELKTMESNVSDVTEVTRRYIEQNYNRGAHPHADRFRSKLQHLLSCTYLQTGNGRLSHAIPDELPDGKGQGAFDRYQTDDF